MRALQGLSERDLGLARQISAAARELGVPADPAAVQTVQVASDEHAPAWWTLADPEGNEVDVATWMGRD